MNHPKPISSVPPKHCSRNPPKSQYIHTTATTRHDNSPISPNQDLPTRTQLPYMHRPRQDRRPQVSMSHRIRQPPESREDFIRHGETESPIAKILFQTQRTRFSSSVQEMASGSSCGDSETVAPGYSEPSGCRDHSFGRAVGDSREANYPYT